MEKNNTRQRILSAALTLFAARGYEGTSVKEIAHAVGIKDSSLYKHFSSKQEIFDTLLQQMDQKFADTVAQYQLPQGEIAQIAALYGRNDLSWLKTACEAIFLFFLKDPEASRFRRLLMVEQYRDSTAGKTFHSWFVDDALRFQTELFAAMIDQGFFRPAPARTLALQFYAPFFLLLNQYDARPDEEEEALARLMEHIDQFAAVHHIRSNEK